MTFDGGYRRGGHVVSALPVHLVFVTKYRRGVLDGAMLTCCEAAMRKVRADFGTGLREFNGEAGHVHLIVDYPTEAAVSALVNSLKEVSAHRLRNEFTGRVNRASMRGHFWSASYFAASRGGAPPSIIRQDIGARQDRAAALRSLPPMPSRTSGASRRRPGPPRRGRIAGRPPRPAAG